MSRLHSIACSLADRLIETWLASSGLFVFLEMIKTNFAPFPILHTERFILRPLSVEDDKEIFILRTDKGINEFIDRQPPASLEEVRAFIDKISNNISKGESILWAISLRTGGNLWGTICLWNISIAEAKAEIGYELLPQHHGKGIMQEVIPVVIRFGFEKMGLQLIEAQLDHRNIKSIMLLKRNGFEHDDSVHADEPHMVVYKLQRSPS